jgi:hypothetical protein
LTGLKKNKSLQVLRIEHQKLGLQGANTLASVLEENDHLREVHCENNDINLQSFTVLVNGLQCNRSLLTLSCMDRDRLQSLEKVRREVDNVRWDATATQTSTANSIRRSLYAAMSVGQSQGHRLSKPPPPSVAPAPETSPFANHNVDIVLESLNQKWDMEVARLRRYLLRNYNVAHGLEDAEIDDTASDGRPATAASLGTMLDNLKFDVAVSADEIRASPPDESPALSQLTTTSSIQSMQSMESASTTPKPPSKTRPHTARAIPSDYGSTPSSRLALPVPAVPPTVQKPSSIRSARSSSSTVSTGTGSARSAYGMASSTLRGFLSGTALRERRRADAARPSPSPAPVYVANEKPPQLEWAPPKLDMPPQLEWSPPKLELGELQ